MSLTKSGHLKTLDTCNVLKLFPYKDSAILGFTKSIKNIQFFDVDDLTSILVMKHFSEIYFKGILDVYCVCGKAEIHGWSLVPNELKEPVRIFSLNGEGAYSISTVDGFYNDSFDPLEIGIHGELRSSFLEVLNDTSVVLVIKSYEDPLLKFVSENKSLDLLPDVRKFSGKSYFSKTEELLSCVLDIPLGDRIKSKMSSGPQLKSFADGFGKSACPKIMVCGGKNVGKSTTLRYLVNKMLSVTNSVVYIDFDIGQPEFTVPGCISVVLVKKPLLGPAYTHLQKPLLSIFLGSVNPNTCIPSLFKAIHYVSEFCNNEIDLSMYPWFINTMGYTKGFGEVIILEIIKFFSLSTIVQLESLQYAKLNFSSKLTHEYVRSKCDLLKQVDLAYNLVFLTSRNEDSSQNTFSAKVTREFHVLFYLVNAFTITDEYFKTSFKFKNVVLLKKDNVILKSHLPLSDIIEDVSGRELVALCSPIDELSLDLCHGFGVILKEVDHEMFHIVTPLTSSQMSSVSVITRGELGVSASLLTRYFSDDQRKPAKIVLLNPELITNFHANLFEFNP